MERRFGFRAIRPLEGMGGQERFGTIDLAGGGHAAVLALTSRTGSPPVPATARAMLDRLTDALPECPVQFLVSRRPVDPISLSGRWRAGIEQRLGTGAAAARAWHDFQGAYLTRLQAAGLADLWCGVAVAAPDTEILTGRVAGLFTTLPYEATPLPADDISIVVGRLLRPDDPAGAGRPFHLGSDRLLDLPGLTPRALLIGRDAVALTPGVITSYWQITPPVPRVEGGWLRRLLEFPDLLPYTFDVSVHLRPAAAEQTMRAVLDGRLARLDEELRRRGGAPEGPPPPGAPTEATETWLLELERREVEERRTGLSGGRDRLREAVVLLALHLPAEEPAGGTASRNPTLGMRGAAFARALQAAEIVARPVVGRPALSRAVRAGLPLSAADGIRAFALPARQAADLALISIGRPPVPGAPVLGLNPERTRFTYPPAGEEAGHRLLAGGGAPARRAAARQWALQTYLGGEDVLIWDPAGAWPGWVEALGGRYVRPGGPLPTDRINLLAAPLRALDDPAFFEPWVREIATLFGLLLPPLTGQDSDAVRSQISAALLQVGMRSLERADPAALNLESLHEELHAGGYRASAEGLQKLAAGPAGQLFAGSVFGATPPGLVALGPAEGLKAKPARLAAQIALRHTLWRGSGLLGTPRPDGGWRILVLDGVIEALKHAQLAADLLERAARPPAPTHLWLLPADAELAPLLAHPAGRALVRPMALYTLFGPAAGATPGLTAPPALPGMDVLLREARLPAGTAATLALLAADQALIATAGHTSQIEIITGDLARL